MSRSVRSSKDLMPLTAYQLEYEENLTDIKSAGMVFRHKKTGARVCILSNDDNNKVFSIAFRTPPENDTGVAHIIEHTVLCGSDCFPVKDPFIELAKGSLNTFLNAMTFPDKTMYPVASCNDQDFRNLMHVYMDAVLHPNIYKKEEIFKQEGWHYELESPEDELKLNGIVYSEMKGAFSSPEGQLLRGIQHSLFPDTAYGTESGGDPDSIPNLSYEEFLNFHRRYYHPTNSFIFLYGDMDIEERLSWLDTEYLSKYEEQPVDSMIHIQDGSRVKKDITEYYSLSSDEEEKDNTYLTYNIVTGTAFDLEECMALPILDAVLVDNPGAPVKQALLDAGIGKDVFSDYETQILQPKFSVIAKNANPEQKEDFVRVIEDTLKDILKKGLNKKSLLATINNLEFKYREGDYGNAPKGLMYNILMLSSWLYDDKAAFNYLHGNEIYKKFRERIEEGYFEKLLEKYFLKSGHMTVLTMVPKKGLNAEKDEKLKVKLQEYKKQLSEDEKQQLVDQTAALLAYQEEPSSKEALETIPLLRREDMNAKVEPLQNEFRSVSGVPVIFHPISTNGIAYEKLLFDTKGIPEETLPYLGLLFASFAYVNTEHFHYSDLADEINIHTGGINADKVSYLVKADAEAYRPMFAVNVKLLYSEQAAAFGLLEEILLHSVWKDEKRLYEIISETRSRLQMTMNSSGHSAAVNRCLSYYSQAGAYQEMISGIAYYQFIDHLYRDFDKKKSEISDALTTLAKNLFYRDNLTVSLTSEEESYGAFEKALQDFIGKLPAQGKFGQNAEKVKYTLNSKNEGFRYAGQVQYAACGGNFIKAGCKLRGALNVLRTIMSYDYLWNQVRVKGGAYGCMCNVSGLNGTGYFVSYRDPNLRETYDVYQNAIEYVQKFEADEREMTKFIIGTMSTEDAPLTPRQRGERSLQAYFTTVTMEDMQKTRDEILSVTVEDIRSTTDVVKAIVTSDYICTLGNEAKLNECKDLFREVKPLLEGTNE